MIAIPFLIGAVAAGGATLLGASAFLALTAFTIGTALGNYLFPAKMNVHNMKPAALSDFSYNQTNEGAPVPLIYGTVKIAGNILWYGNLKTVEQTQSVKGGKGSHSQNVTTGYKYYVDIWVSLGVGKLSILDTYINEEKKTPSYSSVIFNDGIQSTYPNVGIYASPIHGVSHIFYKEFYIGENTTSVPTINFVLNRLLPTTINTSNLSSGSNPAAIVYDILTSQLNISSTKIDLTSFNNAAATYSTNGTGINIVLTTQKTGSDLIKYVLQFVNSVCYKNQITDKYVIEVLD